MIDLRADTITRPAAAMREAMATAEVGDEQYGEDPTVLALEQRAAAFLGHEASVYVPTASMANQIALRILAQPGDELLAEENAHVLINEQGGPAVFSGLVMRGLPGRHGTFAPEQVRAAVRDWSSGHMPRTRLVSIENTHNSSGGRTWSLAQIDAVAETAREHDLNLHLDGARLVNAAIALGVPAAEIGRRFDAVTLCLSKGLGCPLGALIAGSAELMVAARRGKHLFGGAMRQAGIVAAAGVYALEHNVDRIADDHVRAYGWRRAGPRQGCRSIRRTPRRTSFRSTSRRSASRGRQRRHAPTPRASASPTPWIRRSCARSCTSTSPTRTSTRRSRSCPARSERGTVSTPETLAAELERRVWREQRDQRLPSITAAVVREGELVWEGAVGSADVTATREATPDTQYRLGSITKTSHCGRDHAVARRRQARPRGPARQSTRRRRAHARRRCAASLATRGCSARRNDDAWFEGAPADVPELLETLGVAGAGAAARQRATTEPRGLARCRSRGRVSGCRTRNTCRSAC